MQAGCQSKLDELSKKVDSSPKDIQWKPKINCTNALFAAKIKQNKKKNNYWIVLQIKDNFLICFQNISAMKTR